MGNGFDYTFVSAGDSFSLRNAVIPFVEALEQELDSASAEAGIEHFSAGSVLETKRGPTADGGFLTTIAVGVIAFVGGWAGNKFLDEIYEAKLKPIIKDRLGKLDLGLAQSAKPSPKHLQVGIWYEDRKVLVLVVIEAEEYQQMIDSVDLVTNAHNSAVSWIEVNGVIAPVHVHLVKDGNMNVEPMTFDSIEQFGLRTRRKRTLTISSSRPSLRSGD
ncbi:MAG: hypothetical protein ABIK08_15500 [Pseudomonadota bacterium]